MPTYSFRCRKCGKEVGAELGMNDTKVLPFACGCGGEFARVYHPLNVIYRPGGFYTTDKRLDNDDDD